MNVYDILSDAEREAINTVMQGLELPPPTTLMVEDDDVMRRHQASTDALHCRSANDIGRPFP